MSSNTQARAHARALAGAVVIGSGLGVILGGAYMAGGTARSAVAHARTARLAVAAADGYSEAALMRDVATMRPGAFSIARRHDPFTTAGYAHRDRQATVFAARLDQRQDNPERAGLQKANLVTVTPHAGGAAPFQMVGALEGSRDFDCLSQAVYYEARGEGASGQAAVAQVVLNRVRHPSFPKTVCGVVFQGAGARSCQFSFACDGSMRRGKEQGAWRRAKAVAAKAMSGFVMADVGSSTHFHTTGVSPGWRNLTRVAQIGTHIFYRSGRVAGQARLMKATYYRAEQPQLAEKPVYGYKVLGPSADGKREQGVLIAASAVGAPTEGAKAYVGGPEKPGKEPASAPVETKASSKTDAVDQTATKIAS